jgi:hypothetical protein
LRGFTGIFMTAIHGPPAPPGPETIRPIMFRRPHLPLVLALCLGFFPSLRAATTSNLTFPDTLWPGDAVTNTAYLAAAEASVKAIRSLKSKEFNVKSIQEYHTK